MGMVDLVLEVLVGQECHSVCVALLVFVISWERGGRGIGGNDGKRRVGKELQKMNFVFLVSSFARKGRKIKHYDHPSKRKQQEEQITLAASTDPLSRGALPPLGEAKTIS